MNSLISYALVQVGLKTISGVQILNSLSMSLDLTVLYVTAPQGDNKPVVHQSVIDSLSSSLPDLPKSLCTSYIVLVY